ncbi:Phosphate-binding protein PstS 3 [Dissostichus eleginoides]|uniref:Phosphate-binding protein PstS 3 n=1 Tax=Dissostichus eleginoides TaxID=100907 RepID=A0AAD9EMV9_DISEL|nr:Phosphate-binding protein PstS 3 [Dissostichus eleginoides]
MNARQDEVFHRLHHASAEEKWFEDRTPKWHRKCRNWYLNKKSYQYVEKKRLADVSARAEDLAGPGCSSSQHTVRFTRRNTKTFEAKKRCVICNKQWLRGKEPTSKVSTKNSQKTIELKANKLGRDDILLRLIGQGHDMVANDIAYHKPCMNNFKAQRVHSGKPRLNLYAVAFSRLVEELEAPLFHDLSGFLVKSLRDQYREILRELGIKTADQYR